MLSAGLACRLSVGNGPPFVWVDTSSPGLVMGQNLDGIDINIATSNTLFFLVSDQRPVCVVCMCF